MESIWRTIFDGLFGSLRTERQLDTVRDVLRVIQDCGTTPEVGVHRLKEVAFINGDCRIVVKAKRHRSWQDTSTDALIKAAELSILDWKIRAVDVKVTQSPFWSKYHDHRWSITVASRSGV